MKLFFPAIIGLLMVNSLFAQVDDHKSIQPFLMEKSAVLDEALKTLNAKSFSEEPVLDSIVFYHYPATGDSVYSEKTEYFWLDWSGYFYVESLWDPVLNSWIPDKKREYDFDENGNVHQYTRYTWGQENGDWVPELRYIMTYNGANQELLFYYLIWDEMVQDWKNFLKTESVYNADNLLVHSREWMWDDEANAWLDVWMKEYTYTSFGEVETTTRQSWDEILNDWIYDYKDEYFYDNNHHLALYLGYNWSQFYDDWQLMFKREYTNNNLGYPTLIMVSYSPDNGSNWEADDKIEITYQDDSLQLIMLRSDWIAANQIWMYAEQHEFAYDDFHRMIMDKRQFYDDVQFEWTTYLLVERLYSASGKLIDYAHYSYNNELEMLIGEYRTTWEVNDENKYAIQCQYDWDLSAEEWVLNQKGYYFYSPSLSIPQRKNTTLKIYPNPCSEILILSHPFEDSFNFKIYSLSGQLMRKGSLDGALPTINLSTLNSGMYLLRLDSRERSESIFFIKN